MPTLSTLVRGAILALLVPNLASVTAAAAVRGNAGGNGNGNGKEIPGGPTVTLPDVISTVPVVVPLTRVLAGAVDVRDLVRQRTVTVRGQAYLARSSR